MLWFLLLGGEQTVHFIYMQEFLVINTGHTGHQKVMWTVLGLYYLLIWGGLVKLIYRTFILCTAEWPDWQGVTSGLWTAPLNQYNMSVHYPCSGKWWKPQYLVNLKYATNMKSAMLFLWMVISVLLCYGLKTTFSAFKQIANLNGVSLFHTYQNIVLLGKYCRKDLSGLLQQEISWILYVVRM